MKCPYCGDETKQRDWGEIKPKGTAVKLPAPVLYRCGNCAFLYTVPPLVDHDEQDARHE